jgi:bacterioferritin-associated ferredoxin
MTATGSVHAAPVASAGQRCHVISDMIICSCNVITKARILAAADAVARERPGLPVTPGRIFRALGARPQCGTCFAMIRRIIADAGIAFTCPEPLATVAEVEVEVVEIVEIEVTTVEITFDPTAKVA